MIPESDEEAKAVQAEPAPTEDIEVLRQQLAEAKSEAAANLAGWQRAQADFINYKRRAEQDKEATVKYANAHLIASLLPVLDDLDRAYISIPSELESSAWVQGLKLIWHKLRSILEMRGLSEIKAVGEPFDPRLHEAAMPGKGREGVVIGEVQKGYKLNDQVLRPTKAIVGSGESKEEE